jgi:hypothetical protein
MNTDRRILSITAFAMFILGIIAPFLGQILGMEDLAVIFTLVAMVMALVLGIFGRSFVLGKVAMIGALVVCVLGTILSTINYIRFNSDKRAAELQMQQMKQTHSQ